MADEALYILLVDDDDSVRETVRRQLSRVPRWHVAEADHGAAALEHMARYRVDVVISDFDMPGMNGLEFLELVRVAHPAVVRLLLTGHNDLHLCLHALNQGLAHRFVCKPWDHVDLRVVVKDSLQATRNSARM